MLHVLIMGGDARYLEVIKKLSAKGVKVYLVGFDQLTFEDPNIVHANIDVLDFGVIDAISLPVAGTDDSGKVEATYTEMDIILTKEIVSRTQETCIIYTGTSNAFLEDLAAACNRKIVTLFARDDIAILNSIPTAEGALKLAIEQTDITIHGSHVMILGFGRVGKTVARLFSSVGAKVSVAVRKPADIARITEMGLIPVRLEDLVQEIAKTEICINTIPHLVIDSNVITAMDNGTLVIDITSAPGGTDFNFAHKQEIKALHALGLPGKTAPKTAGRIIGGVLLELLEGLEKK